MIKGIRKNVFVMKCGKESPFESAVFILKEPLRQGESDKNIVAEAERLVEAAFADQNPPRSGIFSKRKKTK